MSSLWLPDRRVRTVTEQTLRPEVVEDTHLEFLDSLRESGVTNMFGASPYLAEAFGLDKKDSVAVLAYWMETFGNPDR
jgi:hypothetical protein